MDMTIFVRLFAFHKTQSKEFLTGILNYLILNKGEPLSISVCDPYTNSTTLKNRRLIVPLSSALFSGLLI